jgi:hypothetical protein
MSCGPGSQQCLVETRTMHDDFKLSQPEDDEIAWHDIGSTAVNGVARDPSPIGILMPGDAWGTGAFGLPGSGLLATITLNVPVCEGETWSMFSSRQSVTART